MNKIIKDEYFYLREMYSLEDLTIGTCLGLITFVLYLKIVGGK